MKFQLSAALMGLAVTAVSAQYNQTGPFNLHIKGTKPHSSIDGYASSCHAGAAIEGLCYGAGSAPGHGSYSEYYFNFTGFNEVGSNQVGSLIWNLPYTDQNGNNATESQAMGLVFQTHSNVAAPLFGFSQNQFSIGFDGRGKLFGSDYVDDSKFVAGKPPTDYTPTAYYQWAVCWQYFTGYYYQSVAWVQLGTPHNPTCEPVDITKVSV
ncbi:hypothetical protein HD806DRAFT_27777 [Xylariaceae sp. AK1471]|nr:hypothetical protein HD806DRAFT_27777 [Xylariaceae sp. AK1471]